MTSSTPNQKSCALWEKFKDRFCQNDSGEPSAIDHKYQTLAKIAEEHFEEALKKVAEDLRKYIDDWKGDPDLVAELSSLQSKLKVCKEGLREIAKEGFSHKVNIEIAKETLALINKKDGV